MRFLLPVRPRTFLAVGLFGILGSQGLAACSSSGGRGFDDPSDGDDPREDGGSTSRADAGSPNDPGQFGADDDAATNDGCADTTKLVYTIDYTYDENDHSIVSLRRFDPKTATFSVVGKVECPTDIDPNSMAVARDGTAWVLYQDGNLFKVSTKDASCEATTFEPYQEGFDTFGMGFASNGAGSTQETLYIGGYPPSAQFGSIALDTLKVTKIGTFSGALDARAEFSGTGEGRLFGAFEGSPWIVAEVDKQSGAALSKAPQPNINGTNNFAFAAWGGDFYLFVGFDVFRYHPGDSAATKVTSVDFRIVGAGVSTCAPYTPPN